LSIFQKEKPEKRKMQPRKGLCIVVCYLFYYQIKNKIQAMEILSHAISVYNEKRPHLSCGLFVPQSVHKDIIQVKKIWKNYRKKPVNLSQD